jgi:hypothetical protein
VQAARVLKGTDYGGVKEANRYYHCRNCGFIVDSQKVSTGDGSGAYSQIYTVAAEGTYFDQRLYIDGPLMLGTLVVDYSADGNVLPVKRETEMTVSGGCPLCGSRNWK